MSDETRMTPALSELESALRAAPIADTQFCQLELMYRAGWEAAMNQSAENATSPKLTASDTPDRQQRNVWPLLTLASSLAAMVMGILLLNPVSSIPGPESSRTATQSVRDEKPETSPNQAVAPLRDRTFIAGPTSKDPIQLINQLKPGQQLCSGPITHDQIQVAYLHPPTRTTNQSETTRNDHSRMGLRKEFGL